MNDRIPSTVGHDEVKMQKPFSQACENNQAPILQVIRTVFDRPLTVWEIGSGTGQHACYFARYLPHLEWQPTDLGERLQGIRLWLADERLANVKPPLILDVTDPVWPCRTMDALFSANTLHIMSWERVRIFFERLGGYLVPGAPVCIYGPFNYNGRYTSESNARFDHWLKERDVSCGIRDFEAVEDLAQRFGMEVVKDAAMPANNRLLTFIRTGSADR
ncbi:MAG: DUF938 domain-containing protein [Gammaproteobacteria bacterium]